MAVAGTGAEPRLSVARPTPLDLPAFLPYASCQLRASYRVRVLQERQEEYVSKANEKDKKSMKSKSAAMQQTSRTRTESQERSHEGSVVNAPARAAYADPDEIVVTAVQDPAGRLLELRLHRAPNVPRLLLQIVALCAPHQPLLARLTVRHGPLGGAALHEIARMLPLSNLTDVCLDDSPVPERNYPELLEHARLTTLSLARCDLEDEDCGRLAGALQHPRPAASRLRILDLASNRIGDGGARTLAVALRSNRALRHLSLAGNRVTDEGARALLLPLVEFPLDLDELSAKRHRFVEYVRLRAEAIARFELELRAAARDRLEQENARSRRRTIARKPTSSGGTSGGVASGPSATDTAVQRAEAMAEELLGPYADPFAPADTVSRDGRVFSVGNMALCFLNVAHNELGHAFVRTLLHVLRYQGVLRAGTGGGGGGGLVRVLLDGNPLPVCCAEYQPCQELLERALTLKQQTKTKPTKTK